MLFVWPLIMYSVHNVRCRTKGNIMNIQLKKLAALFCTALLALGSFTATANAEEIQTAPEEIIGLSTTPPNNMSNTRDTTIPTKIRDFSIGGQYTFSGIVDYGTELFTNYLFTGKTSYSVQFYNTYSSPIDITVYNTKGDRLRQLTASGNSYRTFQITNVKKSDKIFLGFVNRSGAHVRFNGVIS